jgi:ferrous iron transport protein B
MSHPSPLTIALAGQPNVGKSTVFNALTGLNQHVGNWPGKTVEQKTGNFVHRGRSVEIVDLPGTYSLTSGSEEERVARDFLLLEPPDAVIAIVNASCLERNLYLVGELLNLPVPVVVGLNMVDVAEANGVHVEAAVLEAALGLPVVELVASRRKGIDELVEAAVKAADRRADDDQHPVTVNRPTIRDKHKPVLAAIQESLAGRLSDDYPVDWVALKLLEGDADMAALVKEYAPDVWPSIHEILAAHEDAYLDIAGARYDWVARMVRAAVVRPRAGAPGVTDRIDRVATHPFWGLVVVIIALGVLFWVTYSVAGPASSALSDLITEDLAGLVARALAWAPDWVSGVIVEGAIGGAGTVLSFVPILIIFFAALGLLEDVGYMARTAYVMDRYMHWMGLHGKSCMPLLLGFGCNVPAILGTRIIEDRRNRMLTMLLTPFVPCTGRLAVLAFLTPAFFGARAPLAIIALVGGNLVLIALVGIAVNKLVFKGERSAFIMEMPLYHRPNARTIGLYVWRNIVAFVKKAGTLIVIVSALVWLLANFPGDDPSESILGTIGRFFEPGGALMGLCDWRLIVALISSFVAKENSVATLGVLFGSAVAGEAAVGTSLADTVAAVRTPAAAAAFLVVQMTFVPCVATVAAFRQESRSWAWTGASVALMLAIAVGLGIVVFQVGRLL